MYCGRCGARLREGAAYCATCGAAAAQDQPAPGGQHFAEQALAAAGEPAPHGGPFTGGRTDWRLGEVGLGILWFILLFQVIPIPVVLPFAFAAGVDSPAYYAAALVVSAFSQVGLVGAAAWFTFRKYGGGWERLGFRRPTWSTAGWAIAAVGAAFVLASIYGLAVDWFDIDWLRSKCDDQIPSEVLDNAGLVVLTGVIVIAFAPVCEETFFRGFIFPGIARSWGVPLAIGASALVFSIGHVGPALHKTLVPILVIGAVFAAAYYKSGNILSTMLAHLIFNAISFASLTATCDADDASALGAARDLLAGATGR
jgi:membrane protease YdiL (CAAX protease family)